MERWQLKISETKRIWQCLTWIYCLKWWYVDSEPFRRTSFLERFICVCIKNRVLITYDFHFQHVEDYCTYEFLYLLKIVNQINNFPLTLFTTIFCLPNKDICQDRWSLVTDVSLWLYFRLLSFYNEFDFVAHALFKSSDSILINHLLVFLVPVKIDKTANLLRRNKREEKIWLLLDINVML